MYLNEMEDRTENEFEGLCRQIMNALAMIFNFTYVHQRSLMRAKAALSSKKLRQNELENYQ